MNAETDDVEGEVVVVCPACSSEEEHEVLKERGGQATLRCLTCDHVHKKRVHEPSTVEVRVVVSQGQESFSTHTTVREDETVRVGDEFVLESDEGIFGVEVTSVEVGDEGDNRRVEEARADEAETVWTRVVDNVSVPVTLHTDDDTVSRRMTIPGDYNFVVGERETVDGDDFVVTAFVDRLTGDRFRVEGDDVQAKNAKRVYGEKV
ncbi:MAG: HVO_0476 family zinc finger protein [Halobacteriales archaeon]|nr:HVO_0476 family zinc finger protein [Halobacteriales archaeon]